MEFPIHVWRLFGFLFLLGLAATVKGCISNQTMVIDFFNKSTPLLYFNSSTDSLSQFSTDRCWKIKVGTLNELTIRTLNLGPSCINNLTIYSGDSSNSTILRNYCGSNSRTLQRISFTAQYIFLWLRRNSSFGDGFEIIFYKVLPPLPTSRPTEDSSGLVLALVGSIVSVIIIVPAVIFLKCFCLKMANFTQNGFENARSDFVTVFFKYSQCCGLGCYHYRFFTEEGRCVGLRIDPFPDAQFHEPNERFPRSISDNSYNPIAKCKLRLGNTKRVFDVIRLNGSSQHSARVSRGAFDQQMQVYATGLPNYQNRQSAVQTAPSENVYLSIYDTGASGNIYNSVYNKGQSHDNIYGTNYNNFSSGDSVYQSIFDSSSTTVNVTSLPAVENRAYQQLPTSSTQVRK